MLLLPAGFSPSHQSEYKMLFEGLRHKHFPEGAQQTVEICFAFFDPKVI